jgi:hypothetical protein
MALRGYAVGLDDWQLGLPTAGVGHHCGRSQTNILSRGRKEIAKCLNCAAIADAPLSDGWNRLFLDGEAHAGRSDSRGRTVLK